MLQPAFGFYIWVSLGIFCTLAYLAECGRCPLEGVCKPVDHAIGLKFTYPCYFGIDYGFGCQKNFPDTNNDCCCYELFPFRSTLYDSHSKEQCSRRGNPDVNRSDVGWLSDDFMSHLPDGVTLACFLNIRWVGNETVSPSVNNIDQIVLFLGSEHLLYKREAGFTSLNIEIEKSSSSELPSSCLSISPKKLDWGQNYIYHPSVAFLRLKNICNENAIKVYEPFSTDSQFYPFNYSEVVLGPGELTSIPFVFLPKLFGLSSAELVLQTSLGGFLVQAKGRVIDSPHRLVPMVALDPQSFHEYSFSDAKKGSNDNIEQVEPVIVAIGPLSKWLISEVAKSKKLLKIKFMEGLLFPGNVTQVALVTYDTSDVHYDSFVGMAHTIMSCGLQIRANDWRSPSLEVPCQDTVTICPRRESELQPHVLGIGDPSYRTGSLSKVMGVKDVDESTLQKWRDQSTVSGLYLLDDHELFFPPMPLDTYFTKSITVKNPSQYPVTVQLILRSVQTVHNCKLNSHIPSSRSSNLVHHDSTGPSRYGFSMVDNSVTEAFLPPYGMASLGPIFFNPSNRCEWKSSALIRNNLSGVEQLSLHGFGVLPMEASIPIDMLNLRRKSIFWAQVKICCIALVLAALLMFLLFWFVMPPQMAPSDNRSIPVVRPKENGKSVKVTKMGQLKSVKGDEAKSALKTGDSPKASSEITISPSLISKSVEMEGGGKEAPPVCLTVRTRKDKRRRPRKRSGTTSGLMWHLEVSSSHSGNSTPSSPMSPITTPSPKNTSLVESPSPEPSSSRSIAEVSQNCQPFSPASIESRPMLLPSATFPVTGRSALGPPCSYPSRLAISPHARAPGPKMKPKKAVEAEEKANPESRFVYDIWGNHFPGFHLMGRSDDSFDMVSEFTKGHSGSFFVRDPQQTLLANAAPAPVTVSKSIEEG